MSKYKGLFTFDEDNHRYIPIAQADGIIDTMGYEPDSKPSEPLIKDEKVRKAVRAWAEAECITKAYLENDYTICRDDAADASISFYTPVFKDVGGTSDYTIPELCGEEEE